MKLKTVKLSNYLATYQERKRWLREWPLLQTKKRKGKKVPVHFHGSKKDNTPVREWVHKKNIKRALKRRERNELNKDISGEV